MALGPVSFSGLASGLDIKSIVAAIIKAERRPVDVLQARQTSLDSKKKALGDFNTKLAALRSMLQDLTSPETLAARSVKSANDSIVTAKGSATAELGVHDVEVTGLARAHRVRSEALISRFDPAVSDGTLTIQSGSRTAVTVNVSAAAGNNSLIAVRDQINAADAGIKASIVSDGNGEILVVRSAETGTANALTLTDSTNLGLTTPGNVLDTAADATLVVDGIGITSASNTVTTAIAGVTLDLQSAAAGTSVAVTVGADTEKTRKGIRDFVAAYNSVAEFLGAQFTVDEASGKAGVLAGDALLRRSQDILQSAVSAGVSGLPSTDLTTLGALGVTIEGTSGKLKLDESKLTTALTDHFDQVVRLFGASGRSTDPSVVYSAVTGATKAGTYAIGVTTAAERATVVGSAPILAQGLRSAETLTFTSGATRTEVSLAQGDTLATVVTKINSALSSTGISVRASADGGALRLTSTGYGSAASFSVVSDVQASGTGKSTEIGTDELSDSGVDIVGTIGGVAATGVGNVLTGADNTDWAGLTVAVFTDANQVAAKGGDFGSLTVTRGVADSLARDLKSIVDPTGGLVASTITGFDDENRRIRDQIARLEDRLREREVFLTLQFDAAERAIQSLQSQQSALGGSQTR